MKQELVVAPVGEMAAAWTEWLDIIPPEERDRVADIIGAADLDSKPGINKLAQKILVETFRGVLSPVVLTAAKPWLELIIYNIDSMNTSSGNSHHTGVDVVNMMLDLRSRMQPLQPVYIQAPAPQIREVVELPPIPMKVEVAK